ncbi:MAG: succinylglutamate desuccinylase/aspartoacylase family protein [Curvibacter sp.]|nr:succinylglutamate desuccinylase/aspartoacylase family protein [Curvibacter sp.]
MPGAADHPKAWRVGQALVCAWLGLSAQVGAAPAGAAAAPPQPGAPCSLWNHRLPGFQSQDCAALPLKPSGARSVQGRELWMGDVGPATAPLKVLVLGAIHGDELSASSVALQWMGLAQQAPGTARWRFVPVLNPDGLLAQPPRRTNAHGVDLNRNFPTPRWEQEAPRYWVQRTRKDPRRWPGPKPLSEPESRLVQAQMEAFAPDLIVSIHAPYGVLDFDGPSEAPKHLGRLTLDPVGVFPGSLGYYGGVHKGVPVVTIELPNALRAPLPAETRQMWQDLQRWMGEHLQRR